MYSVTPADSADQTDEGGTKSLDHRERNKSACVRCIYFPLEEVHISRQFWYSDIIYAISSEGFTFVFWGAEDKPGASCPIKIWSRGVSCKDYKLDQPKPTDPGSEAAKTKEGVISIHLLWQK